MFDKKAPEYPWLDQIEATLFLQRFPKSATDQELSEMVRAIEQLIILISSSYAWVLDLDDVIKASVSQRRLFAERERRTKERDTKLNAGSAFYAQSSFTGGIVTAVFWLSQPVHPTKVFTDIQDTERWARYQLKEQGVSIDLEPKLSLFSTYVKKTG